MCYLLRGITIADPASPYHGKVCDVRIKNGLIKEIDSSLNPDSHDDLIQETGAYLSPGWVELRAQLGDPGLEHLENLETGSAAAAGGGFTHVGILPTTDPPVANKSQVAYLKSKAKGLRTGIVPLATLSKPGSSNELTEMHDLANAGVKAFTEGDYIVSDAGLLKRAMQYTRFFRGMLMLYPQHPELHENGDMNEGVTNIELGLSGNPPMAEHMAIKRDIELCRYTGAYIHFSKITTARSIKLIAEAKQEGLPVTCDVTLEHLVFNEENLYEYSTNLKLTPPLRTADDQLALKQGIMNGTIDTLTTDHQPVRNEDKLCEFPLAEPGSIGLQTALPYLLKIFDWETIISKALPAFTHHPRTVMGLPKVTIQEGAPADLTYFNPEAKWIFNKTTNQSLSENSVLFGEELKGKILGTFFNGHHIQSSAFAEERP